MCSLDVTACQISLLLTGATDRCHTPIVLMRREDSRFNVLHRVQHFYNAQLPFQRVEGGTSQFLRQLSNIFKDITYDYGK